MGRYRVPPQNFIKGTLERCGSILSMRDALRIVIMALCVSGWIWNTATPPEALPERKVIKVQPFSNITPLELSEAEWRKRLTPEQFEILREEGTERAGTHPLNHEERPGLFVCAGCGLPLFVSTHKYDSKTGWPSFYDVIPGHVKTKTDYKLILPRTEYHCARCGGHQGHVFEDGPQPTGLRYCNNGHALKFAPLAEINSLKDKVVIEK